METILTIQDIQQVTHDVRRIRLEKPKGYEFVPGQATEVSIHKEGWEKENALSLLHPSIVTLTWSLPSNATPIMMG